MVSGGLIGIVAIVAVVSIATGAVAMYEIGKKHDEPESSRASTVSQNFISSPPVVEYVGPRYGMLHPNPHVSALHSKWGRDLWDHRRPLVRVSRRF